MKKLIQTEIIEELLNKIGANLYDNSLFNIVSDLNGTDLTLTIDYVRDDTPYSLTADLNDPNSLTKLQTWLTKTMAAWLAWENQ